MNAKKEARAAALAAAIVGLAAAASAQNVAWAWVTPAGSGASFNPHSSYSYTSSGSPITVTRVTNNVFTVSMPGVSPTTGGCVIASAYGGNHTAVVNGWSSSGGNANATIETFDSAGGPANDVPFVVYWRHEGSLDRREAYLWADQPSAASYTPSLTWSWNGGRPDPTITRSGTGVYTVVLPGLAPTGPELGHVQVSPYSTSMQRAKVTGWSSSGGNVQIGVACFNAAGTPTDGFFVLHYNEKAAPIAAASGSGAHVWADNPTAAHYTPSASYTDCNGREGPAGSESVQRTGTGTYVVSLPNVISSSSSTALVTAYGGGSTYATVTNWGGDGTGGTRVNVRTFSASGAPQDSRFNLLYLTNRPATAFADVAWAWVSPAGQPATFTPSALFQYSSSGETITVDRDPAQNNRFFVNIPRVAADVGGAVHASAYGGNHLAVVNSWGFNVDGDITATIETFTPTGAAANNVPFTVYFRSGGRPTAREAYLWASSPTSASYTPSPTYSFNGNRADPTITRSAVGTYQVTLPGLAPTGVEGGHVQVTPYGGVAQRAKVVGWFPSGGNQLINVHCYNAAGALADGYFVLSYNEVASPVPIELGTGGHVWASQPTVASYVPSSTWTHSNGTVGPANAETIDRLGTGRYRVHLPNLIPSGSSTVQVTAYGSGSQHATIVNWLPDSPTGTQVNVNTYDAAGLPVDAMFNLLYLTNRPLLVPAANTSVGTGCNGPALSPVTRPILGTSWDLTLSGIPGGATVGLMMASFGNPALPIGPSAPGCTLYVNNPVVSVVLLPVPNPAYRLTIPNNAIYLGAEVFTQGGALVPNINPLWLAFSNGIRGTVGSY